MITGPIFTQFPTMKNKISFSKDATDALLFKQLQRDVKKELNKIPASRIYLAQFNALFYPLLFFVCYGLALLNSQNLALYYLLFVLMGIAMVLIFVNLVHNAVHEAIFPNRRFNRFLLYIFDLIGGNSYIWKKRHKNLHHKYPNISGWDSDIEQASLFKIYPHEKTKKLHTFQPILIFVFYPIFLLNWLFVRDFKDFFKNSQLVRKICVIPTKEYIKLFIFKSLFIAYIIVIPVLVGVPVGHTFGALISMMVAAGLLALLVLLTPHINEGNEFPLPDKNGKLPISWFRHQFKTTNDITLNNWISRNVMGNFNLHLYHHLFPNIHPCYSPEVTRVIQEFALKNKLGYRTITLKASFSSHYKLICNNAQMQSA